MKNILVVLFIITILCIIAYIFHFYIGEKETQINDIKTQNNSNISKFEDIENINSIITEKINSHQETINSKLNHLQTTLDANKNKNKDIRRNLEDLNKQLNENSLNIKDNKSRFTSTIQEFDKDIKKLIQNKNGKVTICDNNNNCIEIDIDNKNATINNYNVNSINVYNKFRKPLTKFDLKEEEMIIKGQKIKSEFNKYYDKLYNVDKKVNDYINNPVNYDDVVKKPILFDGKYETLKNKPEWVSSFDGGYDSLTHKPVLFDGDYTNLKNIPNHINNFDGTFANIKNQPEFYKTEIQKIINRPEWVDTFDGTFGTIQNIPIFQNDVFDGNFDKLKNVPKWFKTFNGSYNALTDKPVLFNGDFNNLKDVPEVLKSSFDGSFDKLSYKPDYFPSDFNTTVKNKPDWFNDFDGTYESLYNYKSLNDMPTLFDADFNKLKNIPDWISSFNGNYNSLKNKPLVGSDDFSRLENKPEWLSSFDGSINTLKNVPSLTEFDGNYTSLKNKPEWIDVFDGSYGSVTNKPIIHDGNWNTMKNKPGWSSSFNGEFDSLSNKPATYPSDWNTMSNQPKLRTRPKYEDGLTWVRRKGYSQYDTGEFIENGIDTNINNKFTGSGTFYNVEYVGFFYTNSLSGEFTFKTSSDDESFIWIGDTLVVNNQGVHPNQERSGKITLQANTYYPMKIRFGNNDGPGNLMVSFSHKDKPLTTDGKGFYYHMPNSADGLKWTRRSGYQQYENGNIIETGIDVDIKNKFINIVTTNAEYVGYFYTNNYSGEFTFYTNTDDESFLWIGNTLIVDNGGIHGSVEKSGKITLQANTYYPMKLRWGNNGGPGGIYTVSFSHANISKRTDGKGFYYHVTYDTSDMIAWYKFDGDVKDSSGNGRDLTAYGSPAFSNTTAILDKSIYLDGSSQYLTIPATNFSTFNGLTFSTWVYFTEDRSWERVFDFGNGAGNNNILITRYAASKALRFYIFNGGTEVFYQFDNAIVNNKWMHISWTIQKSPVVWKVYLNGILKTPNATGNTVIFPNNASLANCYVGKSNWNDPLFKGYIDDFRIYKRVLTDDEIKKIYEIAAPK